jgi:hypothetical protein
MVTDWTAAVPKVYATVELVSATIGVFMEVYPSLNIASLVLDTPARLLFDYQRYRC